MPKPKIRVLPGEWIAYIEHKGIKYVELDWVLEHIVQPKPRKKAGVVK